MKTYVYHSPDRTGTVAAVLENNVLSFGLSVKSPDDNWNRKLGRIIAAGRAEKRPCCAKQVESDPAKEFYQTAPKVLDDKLKELIWRKDYKHMLKR